MMRATKFSLSVVATMALLACGNSKPDSGVVPANEPPSSAITKVTENGPAKATVQVWPAEPNLADSIFVRLTVETEPGVRATVAPQTDALGRFVVVADIPNEGSEGARHVQSHTYELTARASGRYRVPPLRIEVVDGRTAGSATPAATELLTEEIPLEVTAIPGATLEASLRAPKGPLPVEVGRRPKWHYVAVGGGAALALLAGFLLIRSRKRRAIRVKISAYDTAVASLASLAQRGAPEAAQADSWFVELSAIVRYYLEGRYDIRAPELTTEEFLQVAARAPELTSAHRELLSAFMQECDQVKFAGYRPDAEESLRVLGTARGFIEDTRLVAVEGSPAHQPDKAAA